MCLNLLAELNTNSSSNSVCVAKLSFTFQNLAHISRKSNTKGFLFVFSEENILQIFFPTDTSVFPQPTISRRSSESSVWLRQSFSVPLGNPSGF